MMPLYTQQNSPQSDHQVTTVHTAKVVKLIPNTNNYNHRFKAIILVNLHWPALEDFIGAKFYYPHALADGNQRTRIREKTLEFSSTVLSTLSLYCNI